jgi:hypothetical protein
LTAYSIGFMKWGRGWNVWVYFREPVSPADKQTAFEIIKNIIFIDSPITSEVRAGAAAFESLPEAVRDSVLVAAKQCECCEGGVSSQCEPHGSDFQVMLELGNKSWTFSGFARRCSSVDRQERRLRWITALSPRRCRLHERLRKEEGASGDGVAGVGAEGVVCALVTRARSLA